ncbi:MAG: hypothetical protein FD123_282 [Bacteroidetes bacterium]|nr:MAG: hypothetical protein FD123_282 [Bacteroidota bacterium]
MKKTISFFCVLLGLTLHAQTFFQKTISDPVNEYRIYDTYACGDGNTVFTGTVDSAGTSIFVAKADSSGLLLWMKKLDFNQYPYYQFSPARVRESIGGGYYLFGSFNSQIDFNSLYCLLLRLDQNGNMLWSKGYEVTPPENTISFGSCQFFSDILQDSMGQYYFGGSTVDDMTLFKADSSGNLAWGRTFVPDSCNGINPAICFGLCNNGDLLLAGVRNFDRTLIRVDAGGQMLWVKIASALNAYCRIDHMVRLPGGDFCLAGSYSDMNSDYGALWRFDDQGNLIWQKNYQLTSSAPGDYLKFMQVLVLPNGNLVVTGVFSAGIAESNIVFATDSAGNILQTVILHPGMCAFNADTPLAPSNTSDGNLLLGAGMKLSDCFSQTITPNGIANLIAKTPVNLNMLCASGNISVNVSPYQPQEVITNQCTVYNVGNQLSVSPVLTPILSASLVDYCPLLSAGEVQAEEEGFAVSPNPVPDGGPVTLAFSGSFSGKIIVSDMLGRTITESVVSDRLSFALETTGISKGLYIVHAHESEGRVFSARLIVK